MHTFLVTLHIAGALVGYGTGLVSPVFVAALNRSETSARAVTPVLDVIQRYLNNAGQILLLVAGIWLIFLEDLQPFFRDRWLFVAIVLYVLDGVIAVMLLRGPSTKRRRGLLEGGTWGTTEWRRAVRAELAAGVIDAVALFGILTLMVWQPSL